MLDHVTVAVGNRAEVEVAVGTSDPDEAATRLLDRGVGARAGQDGRRGRAGRDRATARPSCRRTRSRSSAASAPATPSAAPWSTACWPAGTRSTIAELRQRRRRDRGLPAGLRRRHAHPGRARRALVARRTGERRAMSDPTHHRRAVARPAATPRADPAGAVAKAYAARRRPGSAALGDRGTLFLVAADHPARGALGIGRRPDGDGRPALAAGAAGRGAGRPRRRRRARHARRGRGAAAARRARGQGRDRLDEPRRPRRRHLDDGRPVHRLRRGRASPLRARGRQDAAPHRRRATPGTPPTIEACAQAVSELADRGLVAMVEPLPYERDGRRLAAPAQGRRVAGPGRHDRRRAGHDQRLHVAEDARPATTPRRSSRRPRCPAWCSAACRAPTRPRTWRPGGGRSRQPAVRGLVVGRALLYPPDGDVAVGGRRGRRVLRAASGSAVSLLRRRGSHRREDPGGRSCC